MTLKQAEKILTKHQSWRLGHHVKPQYKHEDLTFAINTILDHLKTL